MWERADPSTHLLEGSLGAEVVPSPELSSPPPAVRKAGLRTGSRRVGPAPFVGKVGEPAWQHENRRAGRLTNSAINQVQIQAFQLTLPNIYSICRSM